ncbi:MAG: hypothetical protein GEV13_12135 [Rhodospirillales bacterium]|nr:hypothetical protein [Rhodospirillales bacterium]
MATNIAQKRARKEKQRKLAAAARRRAEAFEASLAGKVHRASRLPILHCLLTKSLFDDGMGTLVLARGSASYDVALAAFLLDPLCLGIKDVTFQRMTGSGFETYLEITNMASPLETVEPSYARKLLRELAAWARSIGLPPPPDFPVVEGSFGDVDAGACDVAFKFGQDGRPFYIPGPMESPSLVRNRVEQLRRRLGDGGFDVEMPM